MGASVGLANSYLRVALVTGDGVTIFLRSGWSLGWTSGISRLGRLVRGQRRGSADFGQVTFLAAPLTNGSFKFAGGLGMVPTTTYAWNLRELCGWCPSFPWCHPEVANITLIICGLILVDLIMVNC